ncbi:MAG: NAD(P)-dependent alcohol dehydrogenase [Actinomycetota bacterium]|nr:NAD(P)-dependent alcohol dehydrogenase [Actinomycetota bacterium]
MKAITRHRYGGTEALEFEELARPEIADDQVLVQVRAAGVGRETWHLMTGLPYLMRVTGFGVRAPKQPVLGGAVAGVVDAVGAGVTRFSPGDEVFGIAHGSYAEFAAADEDRLTHKSAVLTFEEAAALPVSGTAAVEATMHHGRVRAGQRVAITGASGGVGSIAVQIARSLGAEVTGVCSTTKTDFVRSLGAAHIVDYTRQDLTDTGVRYDVIIDIAGNRRLRDLRKALAPEGRLVIAGGEGGDRLTGGVHRQLRAVLWSPFIGRTLTTFISRERREDLDELTRLAATGELRPAIDRTWSLAEAAEALTHLTDGHTKGKAVLVP